MIENQATMPAAVDDISAGSFAVVYLHNMVDTELCRAAARGCRRLADQYSWLVTRQYHHMTAEPGGISAEDGEYAALLADIRSSRVKVVIAPTPAHLQHTIDQLATYLSACAAYRVSTVFVSGWPWLAADLSSRVIAGMIRGGGDAA